MFVLTTSRTLLNLDRIELVSVGADGTSLSAVVGVVSYDIMPTGAANLVGGVFDQLVSALATGQRYFDVPAALKALEA